MSKSTRRIRIGAKTVVIQGVPDEVSDEELTIYASRKLIEIGMDSVGKAS